MSVPIDQNDTPLQRISKLLPADITAAFLSIKSAVSASNLSDDYIVWGGIIIAFLSPIYFYYVLHTKSIAHIVFLILSYLIFFVAISPIEIGNLFPHMRQLVHAANAVITPIWVFIATPIAAQAFGSRLVG